jgi:hypothetical protein
MLFRVVGLRERDTPDGGAQLLASNDSPEIRCDVCQTRITVNICAECVWRGKGWLCETRSGTHGCGDEMILPVVNSPPAGGVRLHGSVIRRFQFPASIRAARRFRGAGSGHLEQGVNAQGGESALRKSSTTLALSGVFVSRNLTWQAIAFTMPGPASIA